MKILLGVSGSISAYKAYDLTRNLLKDGHEVKVVTTRGGEKFIHPWMFKSLGASDSHSHADDFSLAGQTDGILHINLARWCDMVLIAPASANLVSDMAHASATDLLTSIFLACGKEKPVVIYPAMNTKMLEHPLVEENLEKLGKLANVSVQQTAEGELACGEIGAGKLAEVDRISEVAPIIGARQKCTGRHVVITTGATMSPLDPVRYLTNPSSGITGYILAKRALTHGHRVSMVAGKDSDKRLDYLKDVKGYSIVRVTDTQELSEAVENIFKEKVDSYISAAAIGDIEFDTRGSKLKKSEIKDALPIKAAKDVLADTIKKYGGTTKMVGFAAESDLTDELLQEKWDRKPVDLLIGTRVHGGFRKKEDEMGFGTSHAEYKFWNKDGKIWEGPLSKESLADEIMDRVNKW